MMINIIKRLWLVCISIETCLVLSAVLCITLAAGSFLLTGEFAAAINAMPLISWLRAVPMPVSWWLWLAIAMVSLLVVNTLCCSTETSWSRWGRAGLWQLLAPQMMHAGFLMIVLAHLLSATGSYIQQLEVYEGALAQLPDGHAFGVASISVAGSPMGMPTGFSSELVTDLNNMASRTTISPNHPWFSGGYGVFIKQAEQYPMPRALLEVHREPGAGMALAGALLFTAGNILVVWQRAKSKESGIGVTT